MQQPTPRSPLQRSQHVDGNGNGNGTGNGNGNGEYRAVAST
jgi:hypothetical protein